MNKVLFQFIARSYGAYFNGLALFSGRKAAEKAFTLFCTPRKGKVLPIQEGYLKAAEHEVLKTKDQELQIYRWAGQGETVLLLHGWESNSFRWRNLIGYLKTKDYNILAFDAPAHGKSSGSIFNVPLYAACTEEVVKKYKPKYVVAHSVGGMAAIYQQYRYKSNGVEKLVTIGSPSDLPEIMDQYQKTLKFNKRVWNALDSYFDEKFGFRIMEFSTHSFAPKLKPQGLLIHDEFDQVAPFHASERVHKNWPNSRLIKTKGLGHSLHQEEVNLEIIDFLESVN